jgi:hypothetical protein
LAVRLEALERRSLMTASGLEVEPVAFDDPAASALVCEASASSETAWHNPSHGLDVTDDGAVAPDDALAVINYINAFGAGEVDECAPPSFGLIDTANADGETIGDGFVSAADALAVINYINAFGAGDLDDQNDAEKGESSGEVSLLQSGLSEGEYAQATDALMATWLEGMGPSGSRRRS